MCWNHRHGRPELVEAEDPGVCLAFRDRGQSHFRLDPVKEAVAKELQQRLPFLRRKHFLEDLALHQCIVEIAYAAALSSLISVSYQYLRHAGKACRNKSGCRSE